jgi:hypothetical protein
MQRVLLDNDQYVNEHTGYCTPIWDTLQVGSSGDDSRLYSGAAHVRFSAGAQSIFMGVSSRFFSVPPGKY